MTELEIHLQSIGFNDTRTQGPFPFSNFGHDGTFDIIKGMGYRDKVLAKYSFAILTQKIIDRLKPYQPFLEVGAGLGYWAYEFQKAGIDYIATDSEPATMIYVGEGQDGCCANDKFFNLIYRNWESEELPIPQWLGLHDNIFILKRKI